MPSAHAAIRADPCYGRPEDGTPAILSLTHRHASETVGPNPQQPFQPDANPARLLGRSPSETLDPVS